MLQLKECGWKQGESAVGEVRKGQNHFQEGEFESESRASSMTRAKKQYLTGAGFLMEVFMDPS